MFSKLTEEYGQGRDESASVFEIGLPLVKSSSLESSK
jgi:hypothetical protein